MCGHGTEDTKDMAIPIVVQGDQLLTSLPLHNSAGTEIRSRLRLRSTVRGANNRLDIVEIVSYDRGSNTNIPMLGAHPHSPSSQWPTLNPRCCCADMYARKAWRDCADVVGCRHSLTGKTLSVSLSAF